MTPPLDDAPPDPDPPADCWRCGLSFDPALTRCPHCAAVPRRPDDAPAPGQPAADEWTQLRAVLVAYLLMLAGSVAWAWVIWFGPPLDADDIRTGTAVLEAADTVITLALLAAVGRLPRPIVPDRAAAAAWLTAGPVLAVLFGLNCAYAELFRWLAPRAALPEPDPITAAAVFLTCLQPAVVEELFFRYLVLGVLRRATGGHAAVWATAALFAVAHLYNPFGMPYLFVAGLVFGYYRVAGRGLVLPILMHFFHNLAVLAVAGGE